MDLLKIFKKKTSKQLNLNVLHVLKGNTYPCEKCDIENKYCFKLHFADRTICVAPSDKVNTFKTQKRVRKPVAKI